MRIREATSSRVRTLVAFLLCTVRSIQFLHVSCIRNSVCQPGNQFTLYFTVEINTGMPALSSHKHMYRREAGERQLERGFDPRDVSLLEVKANEQRSIERRRGDNKCLGEQDTHRTRQLPPSDLVLQSASSAM